ncbi:MAG: carbamoyltransferase HypF [Rhodospirillales bacterium]|nr:carbamoyltransferase HypF [Rhodospirillales bacterium]
MARRMVMAGRVQGVGFRPFVWRIATREGLVGWVRNRSGQVEILAQGTAAALHRFATALSEEAPPLADPHLLALETVAPEALSGFAILDSDAAGSADIHVPPDRFACDACLAEMNDAADRRYGHPFICCTQCGPRYTLIARLPYDRPNTAMAAFPLCAACAAEYADPASRRFHAEPIACPACGPRLRFTPAGDPPDVRSPVTPRPMPTGLAAPAVAHAVDPDDGRASDAEALEAALTVLRGGGILAVRGIGGYHLLCDAAAADTVARLRSRKRRPDKPFALMLPPIGWQAALARIAIPDPVALAALQDPVRPIVLVRRRAEAGLPAAIASGVAELGVMLPYSPLHHLLLVRFGRVVVATSGNVSGAPVLTDPGEAEDRLGSIADAFLHHDRPILRPADDPVCRVIAGRARPVRLGRGNAPLELTVAHPFDRPTLALGGQMKATLALGWGNRVVVSPHLGDMDTPLGLALLRRMAGELPALHGVTPACVVHDAHPGYASTRLARSLGLPRRAVLHHAAHASALVGEAGGEGDWIVFAWDGAGYGADGTIWGGEALVGAPGRWHRRASFRPFPLLGGDRAAREPWRCALGLQWAAAHDAPAAARGPTRILHDGGSGRGAATDERIELLRQAWERGVNCPVTTSVGRLFDAAAGLIGLVHTASYEAQAAMALEAMAEGDPAPLPLPITRDASGVWRTDWAPLLPALSDPTRSAADRAALFHATLAAALVAQAEILRAEAGLTRIGITRLGLTGGAFQNRRLTEAVIARAEEAGFAVTLPATLPVNDAGLSFGQLVESAACP